VERREAPRARSRRFAQADRSVARATPEARASGNIRPRGVATTFGASRGSTARFGAFVKRFCKNSGAIASRERIRLSALATAGRDGRWLIGSSPLLSY
jgi:hypothetical protein